MPSGGNLIYLILQRGDHCSMRMLPAFSRDLLDSYSLDEPREGGLCPHLPHLPFGLSHLPVKDFPKQIFAGRGQELHNQARTLQNCGREQRGRGKEIKTRNKVQRKVHGA